MYRPNDERPSGLLEILGGAAIAIGGGVILKKCYVGGKKLGASVVRTLRKLKDPDTEEKS